MFNLDHPAPKIDEGVWTTYGGGKFKLAHIGSLNFQRTFARLQHPHKRKIETGTLDPAIMQEVMCRALAETVILDWDDVGDSAGTKVKYEVNKAVDLLMKDIEFREFVIDFSTNLQNFRDEELDVTVKKL